MQTRIGKMKGIALALTVVFCAILEPAAVVATPALDLYAGPASAWTHLNASTSNTMGQHYGWGLSVEARWVATCVALDRAAATTSTASVSILYGVRGQYIALAASNWLADGSRYRAWSAFGLGPELSIGLNTDNVLLSRPQTFLVSAAVLGNLANYTQTSLYSAYISWLAEVSWALELSKCLALSAAIPLEFASRADGQSIIAALNLGVRYAL
jgi:hypothetical protein